MSVRQSVWLVLAGLAVGPVWGTTWYVDQRLPQAADGNAGTNEAAPLKTIQAALDRAGAGDTVLVKAGVYRETVMFKGDGITLSAFADDPVVVDGSDVVPASAWNPLPGQAGVYAAVVRAGKAVTTSPGGVPLVCWRGERLARNWRKGKAGGWEVAIPEAADANTWCYDPRATNLYVNLGGADPRDERAGAVEASVRAVGVHFGWGHRGLALRKLTVQRAGWRAIDGVGTDELIEDCEVRDSASGLHVGYCLRPTVRRCVVHGVGGMGLNAGNTQAARIYDNVVYDYFEDWTRDGDCFTSTAYTLFGAEFARLFHNVAVQSYDHPANRGGNGFWPDCHSPGHFWVGNAVYQCGHGFYIEAPAFGNVVQWNTITKVNSGIHLSGNALNTVAENYLVGNMIGLIVSGTDRLADMGHNTFSHNWLRDNSISLVLTPDPGTNTQTRNYFQRNVYEIPDVAPGRRIDSANHTNLAAFQAATGQESFGVEGPVNPDELGLVWVRVDGPDVSHEPIPLFGNPATELRQCLFDDGPYFWRPGQEWNKDSYPGGWTTGTGLPPDNPYNAHAGGGVSPKSPWGGVGAFVAWPYVKPQTGMPVGWICLMAGSPPAYGFSSNGVGWWSPSLPATGGATIDIGLWMKTDEVQPLPAPAAGGAVVYVEWSDWNGQNKSRSYLVGGEPGAKAERPDLATGNLDWTELKGSVTAPDGARRMALFMGARLCTGRVYFDEIRTLAARPGRPVRWQTAGVRPDGKPLVDPGTLDFFEISLTDVVNRALADDVVDDGKSGWVNLGMPGWDLSHVGTGKTIYDGVPFTIAQPKSCLVLRSKHAQTRSRLPGSVVIPVNRRAHAVYILHAGAWLLPGIPHNFWQYRIRCANTPEALILVGAEANVRDWGADPRPFDQAAAVLPKGAWYEQQLKTTRATVPFELKGGTPAPVCGVYRLEWANPQPNQEIKEIEVRSGNSENVPIILAITGGVRK